MAISNVKAGPLTWGSLSSRLYREPMDDSVLNYSYTDLLWELNQVDSTYSAGHSGGGMNNYYVGMITAVPYVNQGHGKDEDPNLKGPWYITYCATDANEGKGRYGFNGHIDDKAIALNTYYADRIVLKQEMDYAMQSSSVAPWQLGTYYTGVGLWYDAYTQAKKYLESGEDLPDNTYFHTTTYAEIFNDYVNNVAQGKYSHVEGSYNTAYEKAEGAHVEGTYNNAYGKYSHVEGTYNFVEQDATYIHVEGIRNYAATTGAHAEGYGTKSIGSYTHSENAFTEAKGAFSHAEGFLSSSGGASSHAEGFSGNAEGFASHAEGVNTIAHGDYSHAEGMGDATITELSDGSINYTYDSTTANKANGKASHVEGFRNLAEGDFSHAQGEYSTAYGEGSFSSGNGVQSYTAAEVAIGKWNKSSASDKNIFTIGDGTNNDNRHNIMSVYTFTDVNKSGTVVNIDGLDTYITNSNSTVVTSPVTYINSTGAGTYITYGTDNNVAVYTNDKGLTYAIDSETGNLSYVVTYDHLVRAYTMLYDTTKGAISNLPDSVKSIDEFTRESYTNTLHYTTQSVDENDNSKWNENSNNTVVINSATSIEAGLMSFADKGFLDEIVTGDKVLVSPSIQTNKFELYTKNGDNYTYVRSYTSVVGFEDGYYAKWYGTWSWTHNDNYKDPTSCSGTGAWGKTLTTSGAKSVEYVSGYMNGAQTIATISIYAPKKGLVVSNNQVKLASLSNLGNDVQSKNISCSKFYYMYYGNSTTQTLTRDIIIGTQDSNGNWSGGLSWKTGTSKTNYGTLTINTSSDQCFVLVWPTALGEVKSIKRGGVEVITNSFVNKGTISLTNRDGMAHNYYIYVTGIGKQSFTITVE